MTESTYVIEDDETEGELVHWYEARPVSMSTAAASGALVAAFAVGVLTGVGVLALMGRIRD